MGEGEVGDERGLPVYIDCKARGVSDSADPSPAGEWHPADGATRKLWACTEAVRDIDEMLPLADAQVPLRRLKALVVPLQSLRVAVTQLGDYLLTSPEAKGKVGRDVRKNLNAVLANFRDSRDFRQPADLRLIRDKLGAHVDRQIESWSAQQELARLTALQFGTALHACLTMLVTLLDLDVYAWTATDCPDDCVRLMAVEPSLLTLRIEGGRPVELVRVDLAVSPRYAIHDLCQSVARRSAWMLGGGADA